jgi:hypothetical protein
MEIGVTHVTLNKRVKPEVLLALRQNSKLAQRGRYAYYIIICIYIYYVYIYIMYIYILCIYIYIYSY